jgi:hypothetical protein
MANVQFALVVIRFHLMEANAPRSSVWFQIAIVWAQPVALYAQLVSGLVLVLVFTSVLHVPVTTNQMAFAQAATAVILSTT